MFIRWFEGEQILIDMCFCLFIDNYNKIHYNMKYIAIITVSPKREERLVSKFNESLDSFEVRIFQIFKNSNVLNIHFTEINF